MGRVRSLENAADDYVRELTGRFDVDLSGRRVVLDCAHGATYRVAPVVFERLGAEVTTVGVEPDGRNINEGFGSTHPEALAGRLLAEAEMGFAFDGDGDRVIAVDGTAPSATATSSSRSRAAHPATGGLDGGGSP